MLIVNNIYQGHPYIPNAWLYIAIDVRDLSICKVGITTMKSPFDRVSGRSTENPFYCLYNSYNLGKIGISKKELMDFEKYMHRKFASRVKFIGTSTPSEWLTVGPIEAEGQIEHYIANAFSSDELSLMDEDGEIARETFEQFVERNRPHPYNVDSSHLWHTLKPYLNLLCQYHKLQIEY